MSNTHEINLNLTLGTLNTSFSNVSLESQQSRCSVPQLLASCSSRRSPFLPSASSTTAAFPDSKHALATASPPTNGRDASKAKHRVTAAIPVQKTAGALTNSPAEPVFCTEAAHCSKARGSKLAKSGTVEANAEILENLGLSGSCRYDSSLGLLTKKFLNLIQEAPGGTLDLNKTADVLEVQKRRIYDITNVLEGIGLIEKTTKNHIRWRGSELLGPRELDHQANFLKAEVEHLYAEECRLDNRIREKLEQLRALEFDQTSQRNLFLTKEDIMNLPCFRDKTVIAVKAPHASNIEVPDPEEEMDLSGKKHYRLILRSNTGPIDLYLLSKNQKKHEDLAAKRRKSSDLWVSSVSRHRIDNAEASGIHKIIPLDDADGDDYWLRSDHEATATDLWRTEYC
ncbi:hypothetical protein M9H77_09300 [Catharanthus roseus]|uniref:Uncharacterized protein n=1 Tax=Catharanthus roseus TaxID=4058 RepID=A0ACC0C092_CATRO|nr:hypothetical protein M9H77_09300 [Catharanthus roseus]